MQVLLTATTRLSREHAAVRNFKTIIVFSRISNNAGICTFAGREKLYFNSNPIEIKGTLM